MRHEKSSLSFARLPWQPSAAGPLPNWIHLNTPAEIGNLAVGESKTIEASFTPPDDDSVAAATWYEFNIEVDSGNLESQIIQGHVYVSAIPIPGETPTDSAFFKIQDIYTATLKKDADGNLVVDSNGDPVVIQGLSGAKVEIEHQTENQTETATSDANGEILFTNIRPGFYKYRITADDHDSKIGTFWVKPGVTSDVPAFMNYNMISVEWDVKEVPVIDKYDVTLNFTYEVRINTTFLDNAPAAVVVADPAIINVPYMEKGDVFRGEVSFTNHGLVRAENPVFTAPLDNDNYKYEIMTDSVPEFIESKQRVTIPYRVTCLNTPDDASGGGKGAGQPREAEARYLKSIPGTHRSRQR